MKMRRVLRAVSPLLVIVVLVSTTASASSAARHANSVPTPLPMGANGLPQLNVDWSSMAPGTWTLLAVKQAGDPNWYSPSDLPVTIVSPGVIRMGTARTTASATKSSAEVYGCDAKGYPPGYVYSGAIQGLEDLVACLNVARTTADVGLEDSSTYHSTAWSDTPHTGDADWTAYSGVFACQGVNREWRTLANNLYTATDGEQSLWGGTSVWGSAFSC
jgi:hypothetical protein